MGSTYTTITLKGVSQAAVVRALKRRKAMVTSEVDGYVVVYDRKSEDQDEEVLWSLSQELSQQLDCAAFAVTVFDDDVMQYHLYQNGRLADSYNSAPGYFTNVPLSKPTGGNAEALATAFASKRVSRIEKILRAPRFSKSGLIFEFERHADLVQALGLPACSVDGSYRHIINGYLPDGLSMNTLIETGQRSKRKKSGKRGSRGQQ